MSLRKKHVYVFVLVVLVLAVGVVSSFFLTDWFRKKERVLIYTSTEDYRIAYLQEKFAEKFPDYVITIEYLSTGNHAAKLLAEGRSTDADITYDLEYGYLEKLARSGVLARLSDYYDTSIYTDDTVVSDCYLPTLRNGGAIIVNLDVVEKLGLPIPTSYEDLLKPEYKNLISMPNPKSSGTGYMFLKSLVNAWGEDKAFDYFDKLTANILQYTTSGMGPVSALVQEEVAIGLGIIANAVTQINNGVNLKILFFDEGAPYSLCGQAIISGKENRKAVKEVFDFLIHEIGYENCELFYPEKIFKDRTFEIANYPTNIKYAEMSNNTIEEKERLLAKWQY
jgi:iron(III) transport system substrate-binding protein